MAAHIFNNVTLTAGSKDVVINDGTTTQNILAGYNLIVANKVYELAGKTTGQLTLVDNWPEATATLSAKVQSTSDPLAAIIISNDQAAQALGANFLEIINNLRTLATTAGPVIIKDAGGVEHSIQGFLNLGSAAQKNIATLAQSLAATAGVLPDAAQVLALIQSFGLGGYTDLRGTIYETGTPNDILSSGFRTGLGSATTLGIVGASTTIGTLSINVPWNDVSVGAAIQREFKVRDQMFEQYALNGTTWSPWQPVYTGANLNPNVFGSGVAGKVLAKGTMNQATRAFVDGGLVSTTNPVSITVIGTFQLRRADDSILKSGIPSTDILLNTVSSQKLAVLIVNNIVGGAIGEPVQLRASDSTSKIKVNFQ